MLTDALTLSLGYNAALVTIGATFLGFSAGVTGTFLFLRKRSLVSDAIAHATLPGVVLAYVLLVMLGLDGRNLTGLLIGSAFSAGLGLIGISYLTNNTRLTEDAAIGAVLSTFFGFGVVLLTLIQSTQMGNQAGLEGFLLGSIAGMLFSEAGMIAVGSVILLVLILIAARPMIWVAFDATYAGSRGISVRAMDSIALGLALAVTVVGLKIVGLVLIVALLIIPPVAARFWTDRAASLVVFSGIFGAVSGYLGTSISATAPNLPTGPLIVLTSFGIFLISMLVAPTRGILAAFIRYRSFQSKVHLRQGLLALAQKQPIFEKLTVRLLKRHGFIRADGVPTEQGRIRASNALRDEARWRMARKLALPEAAAHRDGMIEIEAILTPDQVADIDRRIAGPQEIT